MHRLLALNLNMFLLFHFFDDDSDEMTGVVFVCLVSSMLDVDESIDDVVVMVVIGAFDDVFLCSRRSWLLLLQNYNT